jgi:RHS repeat-associated protein
VLQQETEGLFFFNSTLNLNNMKKIVVYLSVIISTHILLLGEDIVSKIWHRPSKTVEKQEKSLSNKQVHTTTAGMTYVYSADIKEGLIGENADNPVDNPSDNVFHIYLDEMPQQNDNVVLEYDLKGVQDHTAVARSINDRQAVGGYLVQKNDNWSNQKELVNTTWFHKGDNVIRFAVAEKAEYAFSIAHLSLRVEKKQPRIQNADRNIVCNQATTAYYGQKAYLKGYLVGQDADAAQLFINQKQVHLQDGEYEFILENGQNTEGGAFSAEIKAVYPDGQEIKKTMSFDKKAALDFSSSIAEKGIRTQKFVEPFKAQNLFLSGAQLTVPAGALNTNKVISITALRDVDIPALNADMVNVTESHKAYRFLPHGTQFNGDVKLHLGYDATKIPEGYTADDIRTFYFDETAKRWIVLPKDSTLAKQGAIVSKTNHFTDFINGIIKVPESPQTTGYNSNSLNGIKASAPSVGIQAIAPPMANNMGSANLQFPIKLPSGRAGMQPQVTIQYNSEGGNGWMGLGWDLSVPSISIETRWGVPRYNSTLETETYTMGGEQLAPVSHRAAWVNRAAEKQFFPRIEGAFNKIVRHGDSPKNYWWEVIGKNGEAHYYGGLPNSGVENAAILKDEDGNIAHWALVEVRDVNKNFIRYHYSVVEDNGLSGSMVKGTQLYVDKITYTGHQNTEGVYGVHFIRDRQLNEAKRTDVSINARLGFKQVTADLLRKVEVYFKEKRVRSYDLTYKQGAFYKTLLASVAEFDKNGKLFYKHELDYFDEVRRGQDYFPFTTKKEWDVPSDDLHGSFVNPLLRWFEDDFSVLSGSESGNWGLGLSLTIGIYDGMLSSKTNSLGGSFQYSRAHSEGHVALVDINGDGLPDKVFKKRDKLWYRANRVREGKTSFGDIRPIKGITKFSNSNTKTTSFSIEAYPLIYFVGYSKSSSKTETDTYFTDFNGDGLLDIASNGNVLFNHINADGDPEFTLDSYKTPDPIVSNVAVDNNLVEEDVNAREQLIDENPLHDVVRMWEAPYQGTISINAPVKLMPANYDPEYKKEDGVRLTIQWKDIELWVDSIIPNTNTLKTPTNVNNLSVKKGDRFYFRTQSRRDGAFDQVHWNPEITYSEIKDANIEIDANNLKMNKFKASEDFILASPQIVSVPIEGKLKIRHKFKKAITSDDITLEVWKTDSNNRNPIRTEIKTFKWHEEGDTIIPLSMDVKKGDNVRFRVFASSEINWTDVSWMPTIAYESVVDGSRTPTFDICPSVEFVIYNDILKHTHLVKATQTGEGTVTSDVKLPRKVPNNAGPPKVYPGGEVTISLKGRNKLYGKKTVLIIDGESQTVSFKTTFDVVKDDSLFLEYHIPNRELAYYVESTNSNISINGQKYYTSAGLITRKDSAKVVYGPLYRGWGHFAYNGNRNRAYLPIKVSKKEEQFNVDENNRPPSNPEKEDDKFDPTKANFIMLFAMPKQGLWRGNDEFTYVKADSISCSRMGDDDVNIDSILNTTSRLRTIKKVSTSKNTSITTPNLQTLSYSGASSSTSEGKHVTPIDVFDANGDKKSDYISSDKAQYTNPMGGLETVVLKHNLGNHIAISKSEGISLSGGYSHSTNSNSVSGFNSIDLTNHLTSITNSTKNAGEAPRKASFSIGISGGCNNGEDFSQEGWMDINGDGLVDKIYRDGLVSLNYGYRFGPVEPWGFREIRSGDSHDFNAGLSLGASYWAGSISVGYGINRSENETKQALVDVNGDGLADMITATNPMKVKLNTGIGFGTEIMWNGASLPLDKGVSVGESANAAFTIGIPIYLVFITLKICINPSGSIGQGVSRQTTQLSDIDGDGFPDFLNSEKDGELSVLHSTIGKTNLLKSVKRPFNASFTMDYAREGNTYDMPNSKWALANVSLFDGLKGDGADTMKYRFEYTEGVYNRRERDFYGFKTIKTHQLNTQNQDAVYRKTVQNFKNSNYYEKGLPVSEWIEDAAGHKFTETQNTYILKNTQTGQNLPANFITNDEGSAFPALTETLKLFYEGQATAGLQTKTTFGYDKIGNITEYSDYGDGSPTDWVKATIQYHDNPIFQATPSSIEVFTNQGLMRKRQTSMDNQGNITQIRQYLKDGASANFDMEYDEYGNLKKITRPQNHKNKRFFYEYTYDDVVKSYIVEVKDAFGYSSKSVYEYDFGQVLETTDLNGQKIKYTIDDLGRTKTITGPFELAAGKPYTIAFEYNIDATIPFAKTKHYNPDYNTDIETITFMDGLMRPVQVKKTGSLFTTEGGTDKPIMIVSGRVKFDAFGRTTETFYPNTEGGNYEQFNASFNNINPTKASYDVTDRTLTTTLPDNATTKMGYEIGRTKSGYTAFKTTVTDALNNKKESYSDIRNRHIASRDFGPNGDIWTLFNYNALSELMEVTDNGNNKTTYSYDGLGRKLSVKHPDAGLTSFEYDLVGNMTKKITADIRTKIPNGGAINYTYDFERLVQIDYPRNFQNRVRYTYGKVGDKFNRVGRIVLQEDASGGQEFYYGLLGEITKTIRTIYVNPTTVVTYISEAQYDTWNRMKTMTYPDGEKVTYKYNQAGKLFSMMGEKSNKPYTYIQQLGYDEFEQRAFLKYGNGTATRYTYEPDRRRLSNMTVIGKNSEIIHNRYAYDVMNNILSIENTAKADNLALGGPAKHKYRYDNLYRLTNAEGTWRRETREDNYSLNMSYDNLHNITEKVQSHQQNGRTVQATSYTQSYDYDGNKPHAPNKIGKDLYTYDANGNMTESRSENAFALNRQLINWDEENRIMNIGNNGVISQYTYDASGERIIKSSGNFTGVYINGAPVGAISHDKNFTLYVSPYLVVRENEFSKHYYIEGQRIASKIGEGNFVNQDWQNKLLKAGDIDYAANFKVLSESAKAFYRSFGYPPGIPTRPNIYAHPDSTGRPTPSVSSPSVTVTGVKVIYPARTLPPGPPGAPIQFKVVDRDSVGAGYGFEDKFKQGENKQYFYHPDHLGSTSYITNINGNVSQHLEYMPFGETFVEEHASSGTQPYTFNGKELDKETGLYYYGARYYNPKISMWVGVDPMAEKYAGWSPYNYTLLNPVKFVDPDGKETKNPFSAKISINGSASVSTGFGVEREYKGFKFNADLLVAEHKLSVKGEIGTNGAEFKGVSYKSSLFSEFSIGEGDNSFGIKINYTKDNEYNFGVEFSGGTNKINVQVGVDEKEASFSLNNEKTFFKKDISKTGVILKAKVSGSIPIDLIMDRLKGNKGFEADKLDNSSCPRCHSTPDKLKPTLFTPKADH